MLKPTKSPAAILFWLSVLYLCVDAFSPIGNFRGAGSGGRGGSWNRRNHIGGDSPGGPHGNPLFMGALIAFGEQKSKPSIAAAPKIKDIKIKSSVLTVQAIKDADAQTNLTAHGVYDEERVANFVSLLNYWYNTQGYILSGIKSHALYANGTLELRAFEARLAPQPLHLEFVRRVPVPQLEELGENAGSEGAGSEEPASEGQKGPGQKKQQKKAPAPPPPPAPPTNFTLAAVPGNRGKTRPRPVARALGLRSGEVFRWQPERWAAVRQGGLFADADLRVNLVDDATVQLVITAREEKTALLSPGLTKSMGDSTWGADVTFEDRNFLGTTKAVGLEAKKSVHDSFLSAAARVSDARFGLGPGYLLSGFRECAHLRSPLNRHGLFRLPADQYRGKGEERGGGGASGGGVPSRAQRVLGMPTRADARPAGTVVRNGLSAQARWPGPLRAQTLGATLEVLQPPAPDAAGPAPAADTAAAAAEAPEGGGAAAATVAAPRVLETGLLVDGVTEAVALVSSETTQVWQREWGQTTWRLSGLAGARVAAYKQAQAAFHKATLSLATVCPLARPLLPARLAGAAAPTLGLSATAMLAPADPRRLPLHYATQLGGPLSLRGFFPGELGVPAQAATATAELRVPVRFSDASEFTVVAFVDGGLFRAVPAAAAAAGGGGGGGAAEEGEEGHHGSRLRGDRALSHGVGLKAGVFQVDYAVTDTGVARLNLGLANPMFQY